jgi:hypothetical protein
VNKETCIDIIRSLSDEVRKNLPEKWRTNSWFLLHENAPTRRIDFGEGFLSIIQRGNTGATPYVPGLVSDYFYLYLD